MDEFSKTQKYIYIYVILKPALTILMYTNVSFQLCRRVANFTRTLDPTRPIMFADNMPYDQDLCVSAHSSCCCIFPSTTCVSMSKSVPEKICLIFCNSHNNTDYHMPWNSSTKTFKNLVRNTLNCSSNKPLGCRKGVTY